MLTYEADLDSAVAGGAVAMFDEKYGDVVRVVELPGLSKELCGGTHAASSGELYPFHIINESAVAAGTRRIEAVAGRAAVVWLQQSRSDLEMVAKTLGGTTGQVMERAIASVSTRFHALAAWIVFSVAPDPPVLCHTLQEGPPERCEAIAATRVREASSCRDEGGS